ncbi:hypothetical protein SPSYN_01381 [Sporotomaculum syntrophicum]|uniref:Uncharacterized protein n=1 Tax=Sporotomaculum syntrophicum TaxID=182264 RepID=A0A9D2WPL8_9FIRM|nr:hypothetical protein SPSYN_01381 [Sporotomaculum syntrophicum]
MPLGQFHLDAGLLHLCFKGGQFRARGTRCLDFQPGFGVFVLRFPGDQLEFCFFQFLCAYGLFIIQLFNSRVIVLGVLVIGFGLVMVGLELCYLLRPGIQRACQIGLLHRIVGFGVAELVF